MEKGVMVRMGMTWVAILALSACNATGESGGCTKDTDCKRSRLCEKRACVVAPQESAPVAPEKETSAQSAPDASDRIIEPGVRIGAIDREMSEDDLKQIYGKTNVTREDWPLGEGEYRKASVLFKGTRDQIVVLWLGDDYRAAERVVIQGTAWRTHQGLRIATPVAELNAINGQPFAFYGWGWDYGGTIKSWNGGALSRYDDKLLVRLARNDETDGGEGFEDSVNGEMEVSSALEGLRAVEARVSVIEVEL